VKKVLFDECLPAQLKRELAEHQVRTVRNQGWEGIKNGRLLALMQPLFDVFITVDGGIEDQQNTRKLSMGIIALKVFHNTMKYIGPLVPQIRSAVDRIRPGPIIRIEGQKKSR